MEKYLIVQKIYLKNNFFFKGFVYQEFLEFDVQTICKQK